MHVPQAGLNGASGRTPPVWQGSSMITQISLLTGRSLRAWAGDPSAVALGILQPVVVLFLLTGVFSKVQITTALPPGITYFDFVLPSILVDNAVQTSLQSGVGLVDDLKNGIVARLRSVPIQPSSLLVARSLTCLVRAHVRDQRDPRPLAERAGRPAPGDPGGPAQRLPGGGGIILSVLGFRRPL